MNSPQVTIAIPVFNEEKYLAKTIESAINQTYKNIRVLISDNCSNDNSYNIAREYELSDHRIKVFKQPSNILGKNFEFLLQQAETTYFCFLGAHDLMKENFIETALEIFETNSDIVGVYPQVEYFRQSIARGIKTETNLGNSYPQLEFIERDFIENKNWGDRFNTLGMDVYTSFKNILKYTVGGNSYYGVYKRDIMLKSFFVDQNIGFGDLGAALRTSLYGFIVPTHVVCSYMRIVRPHETDEQMDKRYISYKFPDNWRVVHSTYPAKLIEINNSFSFIEKIKLIVEVQRRMHRIHSLKLNKILGYYLRKSEFRISFLLGISYLYFSVRGKMKLLFK